MIALYVGISTSTCYTHLKIANYTNREAIIGYTYIPTQKEQAFKLAAEGIAPLGTKTHIEDLWYFITYDNPDTHADSNKRKRGNERYTKHTYKKIGPDSAINHMNRSITPTHLQSERISHLTLPQTKETEPYIAASTYTMQEIPYEAYVQTDNIDTCIMLKSTQHGITWNIC